MNSVLFQNIDQSKNKFSEWPRTSTCYYVHYYRNRGGRWYVVEIHVFGKDVRRLFNVPKEKIDLIRKFCVTVPGGYGAMMRRSKIERMKR